MKSNNKKHCSRCNTELERNMFSKNRSTKDGLQPWCNACRREHRQKVRAKTRLYYKSWTRKQIAKDLTAMCQDYVRKALEIGQSQKLKQLRELLTSLTEETPI